MQQQQAGGGAVRGRAWSSLTPTLDEDEDDDEEGELGGRGEAGGGLGESGVGCSSGDNYGVDLMGAAESLAVEAVFLLRQHQQMLLRQRQQQQQQQRAPTFSPRVQPPPASSSSCVVSSTEEMVFFSSLGYAALKSFGDTLMALHKPQFGIEVYEMCIIILHAKGREGSQPASGAGRQPGRPSAGREGGRGLG